MSFVARIMARRGHIPQEELDAFLPNIYINGPARDRIKIAPDSTGAMPDTTEVSWPEGLLQDLKNLFKKKKDKGQGK